MAGLLTTDKLLMADIIGKYSEKIARMSQKQLIKEYKKFDKFYTEVEIRNEKTV